MSKTERLAKWLMDETDSIETLREKLEQAYRGHLACIMVAGALMRVCDDNGLQDAARAAIDAALSERQP